MESSGGEGFKNFFNEMDSSENASLLPPFNETKFGKAVFKENELNPGEMIMFVGDKEVGRFMKKKEINKGNFVRIGGKNTRITKNNTEQGLGEPKEECGETEIIKEEEWNEEKKEF